MNLHLDKEIFIAIIEKLKEYQKVKAYFCK